LASVVKRRRKGGSYSYYARFKDGRGKDVWEKCANAKAARARASEAEVELARSGGHWSPATKVTVREYAERWLSEHGPTLRPQTLAGYRRIFEQELLPEFSRIPLAGLSRAQIKTYMARRASTGVAANTVRNSVGPLRAMLSTALEDGLVRENVALRLPRMGQSQRKVEVPTPEQVDALIAAARPDARGPITLSATAGLRRGEVFALRWEDVDFDQRLIRIRASNTNGTITKPKTAAGERLVPMFGSLRQLLLEVRAASRYKTDSDFVFPDPFGKPVVPNSWLKYRFYPAREAADAPKLRFHDLRHFAVSQLIAQGANVLQIARVAGHSDPSITLRVYSHLMADGLTEAAALYDPLRRVSLDAG
jgi:integrase